jgi:hypothetical protein
MEREMQTCFASMAPLRQGLGGRHRPDARMHQGRPGERIRGFVQKARNFFKTGPGKVLGGIFKGALGLIPGVGPAIQAGVSAAATLVDSAMENADQGVGGALSAGMESGLQSLQRTDAGQRLIAQNPNLIDASNRLVSLGTMMMPRRDAGEAQPSGRLASTLMREAASTVTRLTQGDGEAMAAEIRKIAPGNIANFLTSPEIMSQLRGLGEFATRFAPGIAGVPPPAPAADYEALIPGPAE